MNDDEKLLPCPFCGSKNVGIMPYESDTECEAYCRDCGCRTARGSWIGAVVKVWNRRTAQPQSPNRAESPTYREPTLEDAWQLKSIQAFSALEMQYALKQLGFYRKVQP